jgi:DNA repair protein RadB
MQRPISTGCKKLDEYLGGGLPANGISLIYGEAETGKTTFAMQCAVNCAKKGQKTLFIDCDHTFSAQRLSQITKKDFPEIAQLILLARPEDFQSQATMVDQLADYISKGFEFTVIDTFTSLYRVKISESPSKTFELNRELNRQLAVLAETTKIKKTTIMITSQVHSVMDTLTTVEPVATRVLKFWANTIFALKFTDKPQIVQLTVEKTPFKSEPKTENLTIEESGINERQSR